MDDGKRQTAAPVRPWRFWPKIIKDGPVSAKRPDLGFCWLWRGLHNPKGYTIHGRSSGHRAAFRLTFGDVPDGTEIDHLCENRGCVNPAHLEAVTHQENVNRARKDKCRNGHPYLPDNFYVRKNGSRTCKKCLKAAQRRWHNTTDKRAGHAVVKHHPGDWRCKCGLVLAATQKAAYEAMRPHRRELWLADRISA